MTPNLPCPDFIANLEPMARIQPNSPSDLFISKLDLSNFYHRIIIPDWLIPFFALPPVRSRDLGLPSSFPETIHPMIRTLPMGFSHAVVLTQQCHLTIVYTHNLLSPHNSITPHHDPILNRMRHALYIDDINLIGPDPEPIRAFARAYTSVMERLGFPINTDKFEPPSTSPKDILGIQLHPQRLTYGLDPEKLDSLVHDTLSLCAAPCSPRQVQEIVGRWTWAMLVRRPALSIFSAVYAFASLPSATTPRPLWPSCVTELRLAAGIAPLLNTSLGIRPFSSCLATDASSTGWGACKAPIPPLSLPLPDFLDSFSLFCHGKFRRPEHITLLELRAVIYAITRLFAENHPSNHHSVTFFLFCDNQAVVGALKKGRSSSGLLPLIRNLSAFLLASGTTINPSYIHTSLNPADEPSRF